MPKRKSKPDPVISLFSEGVLAGDKEAIEAALSKIRSPEEADAIAAQLMAATARFDNPRGFKTFYKLIHGNDIPEECYSWVEDIYKAKEQDLGLLLGAYRGSWKTTTLSVTFTAFRIGHEADKSNLVISSNDDSADKITASVAKIIEYSPGWKLIFPDVVPDKEKAWGALGYEVKRTDIPYETWVAFNSARVDPTFVGAGIQSSRAVGKHPTGVLCFDDIHDEKNSASSKERNNVVRLVSDTFMPTAVRKDERLLTWLMGVGTPWDEDDAYHYMKNTGLFLFHNTPAMRPAEEGDRNTVHLDGVSRDGLVFHDLVGDWILTNPDHFGVVSIMSARAASGKRGFARMYRLDLRASKEGGMRYQLYPADAISYDWMIGGGVDYASIRDRLSRSETLRDYFAMAYIAKVPTGGAVILDGVFGHYTQVQADQAIETAQMVFKNWQRAIVEDIGKGETFIDTLLLKPHLRILPMKSMVNKHLRQERLLSPLLELGLLRISDRDTPFLNLLRKALDDFPDGNDDVRDAVFWATYIFPEIRIVPSQEETTLHYKKAKTKNPFLALGTR